MREQDDLYEVLQVSRSASPEVIEAAWRRLARMYHPDVNGEADAAEAMRRINNAYRVLGDSSSRAEYDMELSQRVLRNGSHVVTRRQPFGISGRRQTRRHAPMTWRRAIAIIAVSSLGFAMFALVGLLIIGGLVQSFV